MTVVLAAGEVVICSREQNQELFSLVIGGYGLFGVIYSAKLRLSPRQKLKRIVNVIDIDDAANAIYRRLEEGCTFGDFQYAIDSSGDEFLYRGVFSCYKPVDPELPIDDKQSDLPQDAWLKLLKLAHENKREAFKLYSQHYVGTDGQLYWSDTMQLSTYIPTYVDFLEKHATHEEVVRKESLMIGEHYVPHDHTIGFMHLARQILKENSVEVIYGTIRVIKKDKTSFLPWAKQDYACIIFNLRTIHTPEEIDKVATTFRGLIEASLSFGGSFFLTYHHFATPDQIARAYPQIREFFAAKRLHDPDELFQSEWYRVYREAFASAE
jgi:FAD/FMN-containing dehydrogenase